MRKILTFLFLPFLAAIVGSVLLLGAALIPQSYVQDDAQRSVTEMKKCGQYQNAFNPGYSTYQMDNFTDALILMSAYNLNTEDLESVLTNPKHHDSENVNMITSLHEVVNEDAENELTYVRYWQGFRLFVRPLLTVFSYFEIRRITAFVFFTLFAVAIAMIYKKTNLKTALCLGLALALVNPAVVSHSLQFSTCFLLTFVFIIFVLWKTEWVRKHLMTTFCLFGILTMFFDFYSTPILTYGMPILVLLALASETDNFWKISGKALGGWLYGYGMMWIVKLLFATLFTGINGFKDGFTSFAGRTGITQVEGLHANYSVSGALKAVWTSVFPGWESSYVYWGMMLLLLVALVLLFVFAGKQGVKRELAYLMIALLPILWFSIAAQPTSIHAFFQHRSIAVWFAGIFLFISCSFGVAFRKIYVKIHP